MYIGIALSLLFFLASYFIWKKQKLWLLAGYHEENFIGDKKRLARDAGIFTFIIGLLTLAMSLLIDSYGDFVGIIYAIVIAILSIGFLIKVNVGERQ
ncbi:DUF3784 domain-containing protein [Paenisporosarcina cavernae]|nr:DUF3784 domain-containing protein [Paenisporosarcina cavernae]